MSRKTESEPAPRLPIKLDPASNGEFVPPPMPPKIALAQRRAFEIADENSRKIGVSRRRFLESACGAAATLLAMNQLLGCRGGGYNVPPAAAVDPAAAAHALGKRELVFDVETHHVNPERDFLKRLRGYDFLGDPRFGACGESEPLRCFSRDRFVKDVFLDSDTDIAVLSALAGAPGDNPLTIDESALTRAAVERLGRGPRLYLHGIVMPNLGPLAAQLDGMQALAERWQVKAWKAYTVWGPTGKGWWLDDDRTGLPFLERARATGVRRVAVHKGIPLPDMDPTYTRCRDVGPAARAFPDLTFLVYHAGYEFDVTEGPLDPNSDKGIDGLINSLQKSNIGPRGNVYAELGSTWRALMQKPDEAAHVLGKLLKHVGEDRILWGTDSIWYGSPQDQIQAFRAFEISTEFQEKFGYPALTRERKAKILGQNALAVYGIDPKSIHADLKNDDIDQAKQAYAAAPSPTLRAWGPRSRRELLTLIARRGGLP